MTSDEGGAFKTWSHFPVNLPLLLRGQSRLNFPTWLPTRLQRNISPTWWNSFGKIIQTSFGRRERGMSKEGWHFLILSRIPICIIKSPYYCPNRRNPSFEERVLPGQEASHQWHLRGQRLKPLSERNKNGNEETPGIIKQNHPSRAPRLIPFRTTKLTPQDLKATSPKYNNRKMSKSKKGN